jgi:hypothetical protein
MKYSVGMLLLQSPLRLRFFFLQRTIKYQRIWFMHKISFPVPCAFINTYIQSVAHACNPRLRTRGSRFQVSSGKLLPRPYLQNNQRRGGGVAQVAKCLLRKQRLWVQSPVCQKEKEKKVFFKITRMRTGGVAEVVECLYEALSSNVVQIKTKNNCKLISKHLAMQGNLP